VSRKSSDPGPRRLLHTVSRAVQCLLALAERPEGLTLTELAKVVRSNKATVHRIVATLKHFDLVATNMQSGRLQTGPRCAVFGAVAHAPIDVRELARPHLTWLRDETGETACLHLRYGYERACVAQVEGSSELKWVAQIGKRFPVTAGAPGKAMVAFLPADERKQILAVVPLARFTPDSITDRGHFERVLRQVRTQGYALAVNENVPGSAACAAPLYGPADSVIGAVTVAGAADRLPRRRLVEISPLVRRAAAELSHEIQRVAAARPPSASALA
jgi:DNA-binding IclR family transcriptional regulator